MAKPVKWKVGDKCFFEFKIGMVKEVGQGGRVTGLTDGCGCLFGADLRHLMQSVRPAVRALSAEFDGYYHRISNRNSGLNIPDIHPWLVQLWMEACDGKNIEDIRGRVERLIELIENSTTLTYEGIKIYR